MRNIALVATGLFVFYMFLLLLQIWGSVFLIETFFKISISFAIILLIAVIVFLVKGYLSEEKTLKNDKFIN